MGGSNNAVINFDLTGHIFVNTIDALSGNMQWTYHGMGSDFVDAKYNFNVDMKGEGLPRGFVPEPATWVLMVIGIGFAGAAIRRRQVATLAYVPASL